MIKELGKLRNGLAEAAKTLGLTEKQLLQGINGAPPRTRNQHASLLIHRS